MQKQQLTRPPAATASPAGINPYWQLPVISLAAILFICWLAASLGIRKIRSLEPAIVFRG